MFMRHGIALVFGAALRETMARHPTLFDWLQILSKTRDPLVAAMRRVLRDLKTTDREEAASSLP
ncbi:hypothetical protein DEA8626_03321 [Defluviimonas aquaemixtae]|uniref:Uncharacterized protein n=1 Tax=Albidovulum aquaemixtae TaxID=1542388 RepID=A0A2R8BLL7_9RHOB|nr:hypothetical protein [Defluviimonas aquaemixtae]SPH24271.1 hypothetical protein DEA8626_03321 [Defluviimonas aquaemixtae]